MADQAISSSLSGLNRSKQEFNLIAHNVANADDRDYSKLKLNTATKVFGNHVGGVEIVSISTRVDEVLQNRLYGKISADAYNQTIEGHYQGIIDEFGAPHSKFNLESRINNLFSALDDFSAAPSSSGLKKLTVIALEDLATSITGISNDLEQMRFQVDKEIYDAVIDINNLLYNAHTITKTLYTSGISSIEKVSSEEKLRLTLENLSQYFNLYNYIDDKGHYKIYTAQGDSLIGDVQYFLKYIPQTGVNNFIDGSPLNPVLLSGYDSGGNDLNINLEMVDGNSSEEIFNKYTTGKFGALLDVRDSIIPSLLNQLDTLAKNIKDSFNQAHNLGSSFNPPNTLTGTNLMTRDQTLGFNGQARIAIVDDAGDALMGIPSLKIDFDKLDTGLGAGKANLEGIIQEINYHFNQKLSQDKSITLGNIQDIRLVSSTKDFLPLQPVNLSIELDNYSQFNTNFSIVSATAQDLAGNNLLTSYNTSTFTSLPGTTANAQNLSLTLPSTLNYPFTISLRVNANDGILDHISTLNYVINPTSPNSINGLLNQRFAITDKLNPTEEGIVNLPILTSPALNASLVDIHNNTVPPFAELEGLLRLSTSQMGYHIVIDNMTSSQQGDINQNIIGSGYNFSYYTGLNDLFVRIDDPKNWNNLKNTSVFLDIRQDIKDNAGYLSQGTLVPTVDPNRPNVVTYQYHISQANDEVVKQMQAIADKNIYFGSAGGLPACETTINRYSSFIIGYVSSSYDNVKLNADETQSIRTALYDKLQNIRGVDINEEMANMIIFQQSFAASAKVIQTVREMMKTLLDTF